MRQSKPWPCSRPLSPDSNEVCDAILGHIVDSELTVAEGIKVTTDGINLTLLCPKCGRPKVWYPQPRKILAAAGGALADEIIYRLRSQ